VPHGVSYLPNTANGTASTRNFVNGRAQIFLQLSRKTILKAVILLKYPSAKDVAKSQLHSLTNLLESTSRGKIDGDKAKLIRNLAKKSVGIYVSTKVLELRHTVKLIQILDEEIAEIEEQIQSHMQKLHSPLESIPGISFRLAAVIEAEIGDFRRFSSPDKMLEAVFTNV